MRVTLNAVQITRLARTCAVASVACMAPLVSGGTAAANELGGNYAWQFPGAADRAVRASILDMMQRQRAGYSSSYHYTTNIYGDQVNCSNAATAQGSSGTVGVTGATSSPQVTAVPNILAQSTGNVVASSASTGQAATPLNATQTGTASPTSAGVYSTSTMSSVGTLSAGGGTTSQIVNSTQSNSNSPQTASVNGSTACVSPGSSR